MLTYRQDGEKEGRTMKDMNTKTEELVNVIDWFEKNRDEIDELVNLIEWVQRKHDAINEFVNAVNNCEKGDGEE